MDPDLVARLPGNVRQDETTSGAKRDLTCDSQQVAAQRHLVTWPGTTLSREPIPRGAGRGATEGAEDDLVRVSVGKKRGMQMVSQKQGVLIVDDDENICRSLSAILRKKGYDAEAVPTGGEALQRAGERFFDAVLLDVRLTDMKGVDLIPPLKKAHPATAIVVISAYDEPDTVRQALAEGASTYLAKPFAMKEVWDTVSRAIAEQRRQPQKETG